MKPILRVTADGKNFVGTGRVKKPRIRLCFKGVKIITAMDSTRNIKDLTSYTVTRSRIFGFMHSMHFATDEGNIEPKQTVFQKISRWFK